MSAKAVSAPMRIIDKVVRLAKSRGLTQSVLEDRLNLPHGRVTKWIAGQGEPSASQIWEIAKFLAVDVVYFLDPEAETPAVPGRDEFALVNQLTKQLGAAESFRRLTEPHWADDRRPEGGHDVPYAHGKRVEDDQPLRQRRKA